jgi:hypothetical protein
VPVVRKSAANRALPGDKQGAFLCNRHSVSTLAGFPARVFFAILFFNSHIKQRVVLIILGVAPATIC